MAHLQERREERWNGHWPNQSKKRCAAYPPVLGRGSPQGRRHPNIKTPSALLGIRCAHTKQKGTDDNRTAFQERWSRVQYPHKTNETDNVEQHITSSHPSEEHKKRTFEKTSNPTQKHALDIETDIGNPSPSSLSARLLERNWGCWRRKPWCEGASLHAFMREIGEKSSTVR